MEKAALDGRAELAESNHKSISEWTALKIVATTHVAGEREDEQTCSEEMKKTALRLDD
jgi:hypothetical protein